MSEPGLPANDPALQNLKAQLRRLPQPPVPRELEAKLRAAIPVALPRFRLAGRYRTSLLWVTASAAIAACLLLAVLVRQSSRQPGHAKQEVKPASVDDAPMVREEQRLMDLRWDARATRQGRDAFSDPAVEPFSWPLEVPVRALDSRRLTPDLFD